MVNDIRPKFERQNDDESDSSENKEPDFKPPEQIDDSIDGPSPAESSSDSSEDTTSSEPKDTKSPNNKPKPEHKITKWWNGLSKKQRTAVYAGAAVGVIIACGGIVFGLTQLKKPIPPTPVRKVEIKKADPKPTTVASKLTGVQVTPALAELPVTAVMIENSPDARPQSGLKDAGVVFEAVAEGGITRFLTLFQEAQPDYIGPVRSVRPYYLSWLEAFDAPVAHAGGSPVALAKLRADGVMDLDQFANGGSYHRVSNRYAPHNLYTSMAELLALSKSKGKTSSTFTGFARKAEKPLATPTASAIDFSISGPLYNPHYDYDAATNSYRRSLAGKPHVDERSGVQITPKVVIAIVVGQSIDPDRVHTAYATLGSGKAYIFQDGGVTEGTWSKASDKEQIVFGNANGSPLALNPGNTWISVVGSASYVSYKP